MSAYRAEADGLDAEIRSAINTWRVPDFDALALQIFAHQLRYNEPYARYCASLGVTLASMPATWDRIPPVPAGAFKEAALCTFDPAQAAFAFETSGTTAPARGTHYLETGALYDASLLHSFDALFLYRARARYRFLSLLPPFSILGDRQSSLAYMMQRVAERFGDDGTLHSYVKDHLLLFDEFVTAVRTAVTERAPVVLAGTAFSYVAWLGAIEGCETKVLPLPAGSKLMETGGFKGRAAHVDRKDLYARIARVFGVAESSIVAEYGMTELCSQYYDRCGDEEPRVKVAPPWLRSYAVDENGAKLPPGVVGALVHVDLANRSSCVAVQTEDLGAVFEDGGLVLLGRDEHAELRGCSLDAELLRAR